MGEKSIDIYTTFNYGYIMIYSVHNKNPAICENDSETTSK